MTSEITTDSGTTTRFGSFDKLLMSPTLIHFDILGNCPEADTRTVRCLAILMWLSFSWECILFANAAHIMLASDGKWHASLLIVAVLIAMIVLLSDALIFIASSWHSHGLAELERTREFKLPRGALDHVKGASLVVTRFVMALLIANFMALTTGLLAFEKDINRILKDRYLSANAALFVAAAEREDAELQKRKAARQEIGTLVLQAEAEEKGLRAFSLEPKVEDSEFKLAFHAVEKAQTAKAAAEAGLKSAEAHSASERGGDCRSPGVSCRPGEGPRWRAAQERIAAAKRELEFATSALAEANQSLKTRSEARKVEAHRKEGLAGTRLSEVTRRKAELEQQESALAVAYNNRLASREATIRLAVAGDPRHVPLGDGLLARLQALHELSNDESIKLALIGFDAILILLELAAIMGKTFALIPMTYATRIVELDLAREIETARRLQLLLTNGPQLVPEDTSNNIKADEPQATMAGAAVSPEPQPITGSGDRSRRHAARWRPLLTNGETEPPS